MSPKGLSKDSASVSQGEISSFLRAQQNMCVKDASEIAHLSKFCGVWTRSFDLCPISF